jgi:hypothetical protein
MSHGAQSIWTTTTTGLLKLETAQEIKAGLTVETDNLVASATTGNITLSGLQTIDGVAGVVAQRVLVKDQSTASQNGVYTQSTGSWTRATDCDAWAELAGYKTYVTGGSTNIGKLYVCTNETGGSLGTTSVVWAEVVISGAAHAVLDETTYQGLFNALMDGDWFIDSAGRIGNENFDTSLPSAFGGITEGTGKTVAPWRYGYAGQNGDGIFGLSGHKINTATSTVTPYLWNQFGSLVYAEGNVWGVGAWLQAISVDTGGTYESHAWALVATGEVRGSSLSCYSRGAEIDVTINAAAPVGNYTQAWGLNVGAQGTAAGQHPTGIMYLNCGQSGSEPQHGLLFKDNQESPIKSTGTLIGTFYTTGVGAGSPLLSGTYCIDFRNTAFSTAYLAFGSGSTALFQVDGSCNMRAVSGLFGTTTVLSIGGNSDNLQNHGTTAATGGLALGMFNATAGTAAHLDFYRSKNAAIGSATVVANGDGLGAINWYGAQQTGTFATQTMAAQIRAEVDGAVTSGASGDMPGRIVFSTTADAGAAVTDRLILDAAGVLKPNANDGVALGTTALSFSDLFLASGAVINFNNGDVTLTHSADALTVGGGQFQAALLSSATTPDYAFASDADTGMRRSAANTLAFTVGGTDTATLTGSGFAVTVAGSGAAAVQLIGTNAANGPYLESYANSASPAANDIIGAWEVYGNDGAAAKTRYTSIYHYILDTTDTSEDGQIRIQTMVAGTSAERIRIGGGLFHASATGGDKGNNTINFGAVYDDNVLLTDYVFDLYFNTTGKEYTEAVQQRVDAFNISWFNLDVYAMHWRDNHALPGMPDLDDVIDGRVKELSLGAMIQRLWQTAEIQAIHIETLNQRIHNLERQLGRLA